MKIFSRLLLTNVHILLDNNNKKKDCVKCTQIISSSITLSTMTCEWRAVGNNNNNYNYNEKRRTLLIKK